MPEQVTLSLAKVKPPRMCCTCGEGDPLSEKLEIIERVVGLVWYTETHDIAVLSHERYRIVQSAYLMPHSFYNDRWSRALRNCSTPFATARPGRLVKPYRSGHVSLVSYVNPLHVSRTSNLGQVAEQESSRSEAYYSNVPTLH